MLTVVLGLGSALGYALHDFLMVKVVRAAAVCTALTWSMGVGLVILLPPAVAGGLMASMEKATKDELFVPDDGAVAPARRTRATAGAGMVGINVGIPVPVSFFPFSGHEDSFFGDRHAPWPAVHDRERVSARSRVAQSPPAQ